MIKCENIQQMSQLMHSIYLSDGVRSVQIVTSVVQPAGAKAVIYRVALESRPYRRGFTRDPKTPKSYLHKKI